METHEQTQLIEKILRCRLDYYNPNRLLKPTILKLKAIQT